MEKMQVLDKLHSSINCSDVGPDFNVKDSIILLNNVSLNSNTHKTSLYIDELMTML